MTVLVLFAHADPSATPACYAPALDGLNVEARFFVSHFLGRSEAYELLAEHLGRPLLPALAKYAGASRDVFAYDAVLLASWSAGYKIVEHVLDGELATIAGWAAMDSGYGEPAPGTLELAKRAVDGEKLYFAGHTDVPTVGYLSSGARLDAVLASVDVARGADGGAESGRLRVERWGGRDAAAHVAALREHGPALLRAALLDLGAKTSVVLAPPPAAPAPPGEASQLALAAAEGEIGVAENSAGSHTGTRVREYLAGCTRAGKLLGLTAAEWCAAFVGWCDDQAGAPFPWRAAVSELWADAKAGTGGAVAHELGDGYVAQPGDLAVWRRSGQDPRVGGEGHVSRVEKVDGRAFTVTTIDGNHGGAVARVERPFPGDLVGWIQR